MAKACSNSKLVKKSAMDVEHYLSLFGPDFGVQLFLLDMFNRRVWSHAYVVVGYQNSCLLVWDSRFDL